MTRTMGIAVFAGAWILASIPAFGQDARDREMRTKMEAMRITLDYRDTPLEEVVEFLREISDMNFFVHRGVGEMAIRITMKVDDISLKSVLALMLSPHDCAAVLEDHVIQVMRAEEVAERNLMLEIYDVRDILYPIQDFPGVDISLSPDGVPGGTIVEQILLPEKEPFPILEMVQAHCGDDDWNDGKRSVSLDNGLLMVRHRPEVHVEVVRLLRMLRVNK